MEMSMSTILMLVGTYIIGLVLGYSLGKDNRKDE